ncbi:MAG: hypothetical protein OXH83_19455 [Bryobacterales bacterium]|nr:hypothetical protein [Bryobacterales bacterium]
MSRLASHAMVACLMSNLWLGSEQEVQAELKLSIVLRRPSDDSRIAVAERKNGQSEVRPVEEIEGLEPEFDLRG